MTARLRVWEFEGADLDLWVARGAHLQARLVDGACMIARTEVGQLVRFRPSTDWADGGPILEQGKISLWRYPDLESWHACVEFDFVRSEGLKAKCYCQGPTPLVAAMRCFVASRFWEDAVGESVTIQTNTSAGSG